MLYRTRRTADLRRPESKGGGWYKVHRRRTGRLVTARGETARRHASRRLLDGSHDRLLLLLFLDHGHGHHGHARADRDPGPDESRQGEDGQRDVHRLRARALCILPCVRSLRVRRDDRSRQSFVRSFCGSHLYLSRILVTFDRRARASSIVSRAPSRARSTSTKPHRRTRARATATRIRVASRRVARSTARPRPTPSRESRGVARRRPSRARARSRT